MCECLFHRLNSCPTWAQASRTPTLYICTLYYSMDICGVISIRTHKYNITCRPHPCCLTSPQCSPPTAAFIASYRLAASSFLLLTCSLVPLKNNVASYYLRVHPQLSATIAWPRPHRCSILQRCSFLRGTPQPLLPSHLPLLGKVNLVSRTGSMSRLHCLSGWRHRSSWSCSLLTLISC